MLCRFENFKILNTEPETKPPPKTHTTPSKPLALLVSRSLTLPRAQAFIS